LHDEAALVSGLPFNEQGSVIEMQPRRLLGEIDVECRAEEDRDWPECVCRMRLGSIALSPDRKNYTS
jgi:hypothetical protein